MTMRGPSDDRLSRTDPLVALIRKLSKNPEERHRTGLIVAEGTRLAHEALASGLALHQAIISPRLTREPSGVELLGRIESARVPLRRADDKLLDSLHDAKTHQGILMLVKRSSIPHHELTASAGPLLILVACGIQDPGNVGSLVRLTDAAGADGFLSTGGADPFGPKAVRASAGSIFRVPIARISDVAEVAAALEEMRKAGLKIAGAVPRGGVSHRAAVLSASMALCLGSEGAGLPSFVAELLDVRLTIPMNPRVESINVAAAAAVLLFEAAAQRSGQSTTPAPDSAPM